MAMKYPRLTTPLVRDGGELRPASWDEALDRAASGFRRALDEGALTGVFSCSKATNEQNAQLCWTLGITEHHNAVDNVFALINLALLTGKVGKWGSGLQPLRGQNNVQGGGDMGAIPNRLAGFQDNMDD